MVVKYKFRLYMFSLVIMAAFVALVFRLHFLQIAKHDEMVKRVPGEQRLRARVPGVRGEIKDRNGIVLAENKASFEVRVNLYDVIEEKKRLERQRQGKDFKLPKHSYVTLEAGIPRQRTDNDIVAIFDELVVQPLKAMGLAREDYSEKEKEKLRIHYRTNPGGAIPWVYRTDLSFEEFARFAENNLQLPGVFPEVRPVRRYVYDAFACHLMGYVRLPDESRASKEERDQWDYYVGDDFGWAGVEKTLDNHLRGVPGVRVMLRNEKGAYVGQIEGDYVPPKKGNDVWLTIDARVQTIAERALRDSGIGRGSVVVIEPNSGEVVAMASVPNYNPNKWVPQIKSEDFDAYNTNPVNPLFNRAVNAYVPGSIYKIPIALAGCAAGVQNRSFSCSGSRTYSGTQMKCMGTHGGLGLTDGIMRSCNCFFFDYGNAAGIESIGKIGTMLGLGRKTGIELEEESPGILPSKQYMQLHHPQDNWRSPGHIANTSIGQGKVIVTPLQMASVTATVANGGKSFVPHLLKKVARGDQLVFDVEPTLSGDTLGAGISADKVELVRKGMWKVVNGEAGTARGAQIEGIELGGKTGTAEAWRVADGVKIKDNNTWFITFGPFANPKYAICVLVQGGFRGGSCSAPIARRVLEQSLALEQGYEVTITAQKEVEGNFKLVDRVTFPDSAPMLVANGDEADTGNAGAAEETVQADQKVRVDEDMIRRRGRAAPKTSRPRPADPAPQAPAPAQPQRRSLFQRLFQGR
jgi:penicillin-binding protein 2